MLLRGRGIGADDGLTVGDSSFSIDYGGGDLTGSDLTAAEQLNSSLPGGFTSGSSGSSGSSSSGFNFGTLVGGLTSLFGSAAHAIGGSSASPQQLALLQAQQSAARTNTLLIGGGVLLAGALAFVALRRRPAT